MKLSQYNKYIEVFVYYLATIAAAFVATSQFIYKAWTENNMNDKVRMFIHNTFQIIANISNTITEETAND